MKKIMSLVICAMALLVITCSSESGTVAVQSITISGNTITDGGTSQLSATISPVHATNKKVTWSTSDLTIATISETGLLSAVNNGDVIVTATAQDGSGVSATRQFSISGVKNEDGVIEVSTSQQLLTAIANAAAGDKIYVHGGNYSFNTTVRLTENGTAEKVILLMAHPDDATRPKLDFSSMAESSSNRGISLSGNYWHVKGLDVVAAGDNGLYISGSNNTIEFCSFSENADSGLQIGGGGSNNVILNCDSFYNADSSVENADGFACKLDAGSGNKFIGCRAWQNLDDGWDGYLRGADNITTYYENCWAFSNGILKNGSASGGDGNGFKTGGSDDKDLKHHGVFINCIAAGNVVDGFDHNSNRGDITLYNCSAYDNGRNINFGSGNIANALTIKNTISLGGAGDNYQATTVDISNNSWQGGLTATTDDFVGLDINQLSSPRKADGSLPDVDFMKLVPGSDLINSGVNVGLPFSGAAPDLGAFEKE